MNLTIGSGVVILILLIVIVYIQMVTSKASGNKEDIIRSLMRQSARWSLAAKQDQNAIVALLHANYGAAYWWALTSIARDAEIERATGINPKQFEAIVISIQDDATRKASAQCPGFISQRDTYLARIAGDA